jgi:hypothetical protein
MAKLRVTSERVTTESGPGRDHPRGLTGMRLDSDRAASNRAFMDRFVRRFRETLKELSQS